MQNISSYLYIATVSTFRDKLRQNKNILTESFLFKNERVNFKSKDYRPVNSINYNLLCFKITWNIYHVN